MRHYSISILIFLSGCKAATMTSSPNNKPVDFVPDFSPGPPTIVYKTRTNYLDLVPIALSEDRLSVASYPDPADLKQGGIFLLPTRLNGNYMLDNRGIGLNVAFIKLTYVEYAKLNSPPSRDELYELIVDKDPLLEMCNCGNKMRFTDIVGQLNQAIDGGKLREGCKTLK